MEHQTQILILEDHDIVIWALKNMISKDFPDACTYSAHDLRQGLGILQETSIDLIVMDIDLPGGNSPRMIADIRAIQPQVPILVYTGLTDEDSSLDYLAHGANGFLSKRAPFATVLEAIRIVLNGGRYLNPSLQTAILEKFLDNSPRSGTHRHNYGLTSREKEIIALLFKGKWTKEIAGELGLKIQTISAYKGKILEKFQVHNSVELLLKIQKEMPELIKKK